MALRARQQWMAESVAQCFDAPGMEKKVEDAFKEYANAKKINEFLEGKAKSHLFFYYQKGK